MSDNNGATSRNVTEFSPMSPGVVEYHSGMEATDSAEPVAAPDEPRAQSDEPLAQSDEPTEDNDLIDRLQLFDAGSTETSETSEGADEAEPFSYESQRFKDLEEFVSKEFDGLSLREAVEGIKQLTEQFADLRQQQAVLRAEKAAIQLKADWGVNDAEYARRADAVVAYLKKMGEEDPDLAAKYDSVEGIKLVWSHLSSKTPGGVKAKGGVASVGDIRSFKRSEIDQMMRNQPAVYQANMAAIRAAMKAGRIDESA